MRYFDDQLSVQHLVNQFVNVFMKSVSHCLFTGALLDTFFLGRIGVVAIYSYPHQGFNGSTVFLITMSVFDVIEINIIKSSKALT